MTLITRRAALGGFAALPALGVPNANAQTIANADVSPEFSEKCLRMAFLLGGMQPYERELVLLELEAELDRREARTAS